MPRVIDNKIWHNGQKIGWIDGEHIRDEENKKLGYFENGFVYNESGYKVAYIKENELCYENGRSPSELEHVNELIEGGIPMLAKCAIKVLFDL
jgi:hypothetical protein